MGCFLTRAMEVLGSKHAGLKTDDNKTNYTYRFLVNQYSMTHLYVGGSEAAKFVNVLDKWLLH